METSTSSAPDVHPLPESAVCDRDRRSQARRRRTSAFSLIEVTLSIGIIAFAFVAVFGLIPTGLNLFRDAMDYSITSEIAHRVIVDFQTNNMLGTWDPTFAWYTTQQDKYNDNGESDPKNGIYVVNAVVTGTPVPGTTNPDPNLKTVVIQVARNPSGQLLATDPTTKLFTGALQSTPGKTNAVKVFNYVHYIAKTQ